MCLRAPRIGAHGSAPRRGFVRGLRHRCIGNRNARAHSRRTQPVERVLECVLEPAVRLPASGGARQPASGAFACGSLLQLLRELGKQGFDADDLSDNEAAKSHVRYVRRPFDFMIMIVNTYSGTTV